MSASFRRGHLCFLVPYYPLLNFTESNRAQTSNTGTKWQLRQGEVEMKLYWSLRENCTTAAKHNWTKNRHKINRQSGRLSICISRCGAYGNRNASRSHFMFLNAGRRTKTASSVDASQWEGANKSEMIPFTFQSYVSAALQHAPGRMPSRGQGSLLSWHDLARCFGLVQCQRRWC